MFILLFFVFLIQFLSFWLLEPISSFFTYVLEIKIFPLIALLGFVFLFSKDTKRS